MTKEEIIAELARQVAVISEAVSSLERKMKASRSIFLDPIGEGEITERIMRFKELGDTQSYLLKAVKAYEPWRSPEEPPAMYEPVILCRVDKEGNKRVEAGSLQEGGWYKVYGTRTKSILGWQPMPEWVEDHDG